MQRMQLSDLVRNEALDSERISALLGAMQMHTRPVKPQRLGVIGEEHFRERFNDWGIKAESFAYTATKKMGDDGLPFVLESAFGWLGEDAEETRLIHAGANWSAAIRNPFRSFGTQGVGLEQELTDLKAGSHEPILFALHLAHPRIRYTDRGKSAVVVT